MAEGKAISHIDQESLGKSGLKPSGEREGNSRPQQLPNQPCPQCGSKGPFYKDGMRYTSQGSVQRFLCRSCGFRFSDPTANSDVKVTVLPQSLKQSHTRKNLLQPNILQGKLSVEPLIKDSSFKLRKNIASHGISEQTIIGKRLYAFLDYNRERRVCASEIEAKNLSIATETQTVAGATNADLKGLMTVHMAKSLQQGLAKATVQRRIETLVTLVNRGANLNNPENVWQTIENQGWKDGTKQIAATAYKHFCKTQKIQLPTELNFNKWQRTERIPYVPHEEELDQLIAGTNPKTSAFLQLLKETGIRSGEAWRLRWTDFDFETKILTLNDVEKKGKPRQFRISDKLSATLQRLPKDKEHVWDGNLGFFRINYGTQRRRIAAKTQNPRLNKISFHSFRHFYATMLYRKTQNILLVQERLGHRSILNTMVYTHLIDWKSEDYNTATATTVEEARKLAEDGWDKWDVIDGVHIYRKRK